MALCSADWFKYKLLITTCDSVHPLSLCVTHTHSHIYTHIYSAVYMHACAVEQSIRGKGIFNGACCGVLNYLNLRNHLRLFAIGILEAWN